MKFHNAQNVHWQKRVILLFSVKGIPMQVYQPAALLRDPSLKRDTWEDFKKIYYKYSEVVNPQHWSPFIITKKQDQ